MSTNSSSTPPRYFGCHVSCAGGFEKALENGKALGVNTIQLHPSPPQRWNAKPFAAGYEKKFVEARVSSGVEKVFFHAIYLINLANPDPQALARSSMSLSYYLDLMHRIEGDGVIFHVGSGKHQESEAEAHALAAKTINSILEKTPGDAKLLLEVAAGSGAVIGDRMEELATIYDDVKDKERVGFALDTQHMWASGYDVAGGLDGLVKEIDRVFGLERVHAIHLNDSKTDLGSRTDRHENLGEGKIGRALEAVFSHPALREIPFVLETPAMKDIEAARGEVEKMRSVKFVPAAA